MPKQSRFFVFSFFLTIFCLAPSSSLAQDNPPLKIGYVHANLIIDEAPQGKAAFEQLQQEFDERRQRVIAMEFDLGRLQNQLTDASSSSLSEDERRSIQGEIRSLTRDIERSTSELNEDFNYRRNEELTKLQQIISNVIIDMAREQEFDLIVQSPVVWASDRINITQDVLAELNRIFNQ